MMNRRGHPDFEDTCRQTWIAFKGYRKRVRDAPERLPEVVNEWPATACAQRGRRVSVVRRVGPWSVDSTAFRPWK